MAGALRKTMEYLGLSEAEDRYHDDYNGYDEPVERGQFATASAHDDGHEAEVTPFPQRHSSVAEVAHEPEVTEMNRITTIHPRTYNEAKTIGESFRSNVPVIMNLSEMDDSDAKRLVDFAAGLAFGLHGTIERITTKVFLLSPSHVAVDGSAAGTTTKQGVFNQS